MIDVTFIDGEEVVSMAASLHTEYIATGDLCTHARCHIFQPIPDTCAYLVLDNSTAYRWSFVRRAHIREVT